MTKTIRKNLLTALCFTFAFSAICGAHALTAKAEENDVNALDSAFSSLKVEDGASVRLSDDEYGRGISWKLSMEKTAYEALSSDYSDVTFGLYIAPEMYYDVHAFNTQENIDAYYAVNPEDATALTDKAALYYVSTSGLVENTDNTVSFRGSLVDIMTDNLILDYRAVGFVSYTVGDQTEKHFLVNDNAVTCPVEVAELAVENLDETEDATQIATLKENYIIPAVGSVTWGAKEETVEDCTWYGKWYGYSFSSWDAKAYNTLVNKELKNGLPAATWDKQGNRWVDSKYSEPEYSYVKGDQSYEYGYDTNKIDGTWTIVGKTTCSVNGQTITKQSYTRKMLIMNMGAFPKIGQDEENKDIYGVNGNAIGCGLPSNNYGNNRNDSVRLDILNYDEEKQAYVWTERGGYKYRYAYSQKATGDFIVDFTLEFEIQSNNRHEFRIWTSADTYVAIDGHDSNNSDAVFMYNQSGWHSEIRLKGNESVFTNPNHAGTGALSLRVVNYNSTLYFFSNTYKDSDGNVQKSETYKLLMSVSSTQADLAYNNMTINKNSNGLKNGLDVFYNAAKKTEFAFGFAGFAGENGENDPLIKKYGTIVLEDDDEKVAAFMSGYLNN